MHTQPCGKRLGHTEGVALLITAALKQQLAQRGVTSLLNPGFSLPDDSVFEGPCSLKRMQAVYSLAMGAFSYAKSGYFFGVKFGRYCSIGEDVQIGRGSHPPYWGSTSPLFYRHHKHVFDQEIPEAANFKPNAPPQRASITAIGNDVRIGTGALLSQGITVGDGAVIQPFTVVTKDVPPYAIIAGNPGTITGMRCAAGTIARMQELAWWRYAFWDFPGAPVAEPEAFLDHIEWCVKAGMKPYAPAPVVLSAMAG